MKAFTLMFLAHLVGDYYLQPQRLAQAKSRNTAYVLIHALIYAIAMGATWLALPHWGYAAALAVSALTHAAIDIVKQLILNYRARAGVLSIAEDRVFFIVDQAMHLIIITACAFWASLLSCDENALHFLEYTVPEVTGINGYTLIGGVTAAIGVFKPANVFIRKVLVKEKPSLQREGELNRGAHIGALERIITLALLYLGQYSAIALVFTAKSIARFKEFENRSFAEYYLHGTLMSVIAVIFIFGLIHIFGA